MTNNTHNTHNTHNTNNTNKCMIQLGLSETIHGKKVISIQAKWEKDAILTGYLISFLNPIHINLNTSWTIDNGFYKVYENKITACSHIDCGLLGNNDWQVLVYLDYNINNLDTSILLEKTNLPSCNVIIYDSLTQFSIYHINNNPHFFGEVDESLIQYSRGETSNNIIGDSSMLRDDSSMLRGDVNNDGTISAFDATYILSWLVNQENYELDTIGKLRADVNNDGTITAYDATYLLSWLVGIPNYEIPSLNLTIQCLHQNRENTVQMTNPYTFNDVLYDNDIYIGMNIGKYILTGVTSDHPLGFGITDNNLFEVISGTEYGEKEIGQEGIIVKHYTGDIIFEVKGDFGRISYHCFHHGYMGGEKRFLFDSSCVMGELIDVKKGWNLIGTSENGILDNNSHYHSTISKLYKYENNEYISNTNNILDSKKSYWMYSEWDGKIFSKIENKNTDNTFTIYVNAGWNCFSISRQSVLINNAIIEPNSLSYYDTSLNKYSSINNNIILPNVGYMIKCNSDGIIIV